MKKQIMKFLLRSQRMPLETFFSVVKQIFALDRKRENDSAEPREIETECVISLFSCFFHDFLFINRSLSVVSDSGYKLFTIQSVNKVDEIFTSDHVDTRIAERLFSSSLVATVWSSEQNKLKVSVQSSHQ